MANDVYTPAQLYNIYSLESNLGVEEVIQEEAEYLKAANDEEIMKWMGRWLESAKRAEEDQGFVRDEAAAAHLEAFEQAEGTGFKGILQGLGVSCYGALCHFDISKLGSLHEVNIPCHILREHL